MRLITRRFEGRLAVLFVALILVWGATYLPRLGFLSGWREGARGVCNVLAIWWARKWVRQMSLRMIPPEERTRKGDPHV